MPDWRQFVRERLGRPGLDPASEAEIFAELAHHLEDLHEDFCQHGVSAEEAAQAALGEVADWSKLGQHIRQAKCGEGAMNERGKHLWVPGLVTLAVSMSILMIGVRAGLRPQVIWIDPRIPLLLYIPWLLVLPVIGALGAYWSRYAGGGLRARMVAGLFPVAALLALFLLVLPVGLVVDRHVPLALMLKSVAINLVGWVAIPGIALLAGALPFLRGRAEWKSSAR